MFVTLKNIVHLFLTKQELIKNMTYKELTDRYAGSSFGLLMSIIQPLLIIAIYTLVFTFIFKVKMSGENAKSINYAFYAIAGLVPWIAVSEGISKGTSSVFSKSSIVKQAIFPTEVLPIATALSTLWPLVVSFVIYLVAAIFLIPQHLTWYLLLLPAIFFFQALFSIGLAWLLSIVGVYFRDIGELVGVLLMVGMFITPIMYLEDMIPGVFIWPMRFNPFAHLIFIYRDVVFYGKILHPWSFLIFGVLSVFVFMWGYIAFNKMKHLFANVL